MSHASAHTGATHSGITTKTAHTSSPSGAFRTSHTSSLPKARPVRLAHFLLGLQLAEVAKRRLLPCLGNIDGVLNVRDSLLGNLAKQPIQHLDMFAGG